MAEMPRHQKELKKPGLAPNPRVPETPQVSQGFFLIGLSFPSPFPWALPSAVSREKKNPEGVKELTFSLQVKV